MTIISAADVNDLTGHILYVHKFIDLSLKNKGREGHREGHQLSVRTSFWKVIIAIVIFFFFHCGSFPRLVFEDDVIDRGFPLA